MEGWREGDRDREERKGGREGGKEEKESVWCESQKAMLYFLLFV